MLAEAEIIFARRALSNPQSQLKENLASDIHETNRVPDPYVFVSRDGKLYSPTGQRIEDIIDDKTPIGQAEKSAFQTIQSWMETNDQGTAIWFSPKCPPKYDESKIVISEISQVDKTRILFNRVVMLDNISQDGLLSLANNSCSDSTFHNPEELRSAPFFPTPQEFALWFDQLANITHQTEMITTGEDILIKTDTYAQVEDLWESLAIAGRNQLYASYYQRATQRGLIGSFSGSCGSAPQTAFEVFAINARPLNEKKTLECTCPYCQKRVKAEIYGGKIHCPKCNKKANYIC